MDNLQSGAVGKDDFVKISKNIKAIKKQMKPKQKICMEKQEPQELTAAIQTIAANSTLTEDELRRVIECADLGYHPGKERLYRHREEIKRVLEYGFASGDHGICSSSVMYALSLLEDDK